jgi:hypothetical protein
MVYIDTLQMYISYLMFSLLVDCLPSSNGNDHRTFSGSNLFFKSYTNFMSK